MSISDWFRWDRGPDYELARIVASGDDQALLRYYHSHLVDDYHSHNGKNEFVLGVLAVKGITFVPVAERDAGFMKAYLIIKNAFAALPDKVRYKDEYVQALLAARDKKR